MSFGGQSQVLFIRDALWRRKGGTSTGRAAIMVGSGFSRNADPMSSGSRPFPIWSTLTRSLASKLYPASAPELHAAAMADAAGTSGALRLAQEFEAVFGRFQLDDFIRSMIPDQDHRPGELHARLLSLPWADVFTPNWDTLLERAQADVFERAYDVVRTPSEIPSAAVPRIVKLHGSLPAHHPFIVTEEDYRTYPNRFAPFVNLVQQAMMENTFVLVGFSGDDPNFLHWSGWIRDNLGVQSPKIYLVGWLGLAPHRRRMLEDRNVVPVDLSGLPQAASWPEPLRHRYATEWFLASLEQGRPARPSSWPTSQRPTPTPPAHLLPLPEPIAAEEFGEPWPNTAHDASLEKHAAALDAATTAWAASRARYPGWLVAPSSVRASLWQQTEHWLGNLQARSRLLEPSRRLAFLGQLLWRFDAALVMPHADADLMRMIEEALVSVDTGAQTLTIPGKPPIGLASGEQEAVSMSLLELTRFARFEGRREDFERHLARYRDATSGEIDPQHTATYECCLWSLHALEHARLDQLLDGWIIDRADPVWGLRKAGLLAGTSRVREAKATFGAALARIRRERRRDTEDHAANSREAWALWLSLALNRRPEISDSPASVVSDPFDRWRELSLHGCNAFEDAHSLIAEVVPPGNGRFSIERGFDLGDVSHTSHLGSGMHSGIRAALQLLRLAEVTGLPPSANRMTILRTGLSAAVAVLSDHEPWFCAFTATRLASTGSDDVIETYFTRSRVAVLDMHHVRALTSAMLSTIDHALPRCRSNDERAHYWFDRLRVSTEVLSRLTLRLAPSEAAASLDKAIELHKQEWPILHAWLAPEISRLFSRSIETLTPTHLAGRLLALVALPIPGRSGLGLSEPGHGWTDPLLIVRRLGVPVEQVRNENNEADWAQVVRRLLQDGRSGGSVRSHAVTRLHQLCDLELLDRDEIATLAAVVWDSDHLSPEGLPNGLNFYPWVALVLPEAVAGQAGPAFRRTFLSSLGATATSRGDLLQNIGAALMNTRTTSNPFQIEAEDVPALDNAVRAWASEIKEAKLEALPGGTQKFWRETDGLGHVMVACALNSELLEAVWEKVQAFNTKSNGTGFMLFPGLARGFAGRIPQLAQMLRRGLVADDPEVASAAAKGLFEWLRASQWNKSVPDVPDDVIREVGIAVAARRRGLLLEALGLATWLLNEGPVRYHHLLREECGHGLGYLFEEAAYTGTTARLAGEGIDVPLLRLNCVRLAMAMRDTGPDVPATAQAWIDAAVSDPLPEVRNAVLRRLRTGPEDLGAPATT